MDEKVVDYQFMEYSLHTISDDLMEKFLDFEEIQHRDTTDFYGFETYTLQSRNWRRRSHRSPPPNDQTEFRMLVLSKTKNHSSDEEIIASGYARFHTPQIDANQERINMFIQVHPKYRNQGLATKLYGHLKEFAVKHNRTKYYIHKYVDSQPEIFQWLKREGFKPKLTIKSSRLYKDNINWEFIQSKEIVYDKKFAKYRLELFDNKRWCNSILEIDGFAERMADFLTEVVNLMPREELDLDDEIITPSDLKTRARHIKSMDTHDIVKYYLIDPKDDKIVALSGVRYLRDDPIRELQTRLTAVRKDYHRQGIATYLKIKVIRHITEHFPDFDFISTGNSSVNKGMLGINHNLGFVNHIDIVELEKAVIPK